MITLHEVTSPDPPSRSKEATTSGVRGVLQGLRIVIVDDDDDARDLLSTVLTQRSAEVLVADCALAAFELVQRESPDALISDIAMPEEDGYSLIARVRTLCEEKGRSLLAIAVTAYAGRADRARALEAGFDAHLAKPIDLDTLVDLLIDHRSARDLGVPRRAR